MPDRPVLTARWRDLLLLNFDVPTSVIEPLVPPGTEPDLFEGRAYISVVGFRFHDARLFGVPFPAHTHFDEINLRFYVRRVVEGETRHGVVFVREIVPRWAVAATANWLYNENYVARPMRSNISVAGNELAPGDTVEYAWSSGSRRAVSLPNRKGSGDGSISMVPGHDWNRLAARVSTPLAISSAGSLEYFFVEHYWGYVRGRDGTTREYRVMHAPWRVARVDNVVWACEMSANYQTVLDEYLSVPPVSALVADGSPVQLFRGRRV